MTEEDEPRLIGRAGPRERLNRAAVASTNGRRSAVFVSGEAGMGKTSLIRAVLDESSADTTVIGWGTCWHGEGAPGFWPWMQVFDDLAQAVGNDAALAAADRDRDALSLLIRDLGPGSAAIDDSDRGRLLLLDAAVRWIEKLAANQAVVIVLDDLQWADASTLELLDYLIAAPSKAKLLVVGAYRHDELDPDGRTRLATLQSRADHIHLEGLDVDAVARLVETICGADVAPSLSLDLHRRTGGHPLFVSELARLSEVGIEDQLPSAVTGAVARRLTTLPIDSRLVLDAASVLGNRLLPDVLGSVLDTTPAMIVHHLGPAITTGLVKGTTSDQFWFTHDLYRETLYGELDISNRVHLHGQIGEALQARNARGVDVSPSDLARHFVRSITVTDPTQAVRWANAAALEERNRLAFVEAAGHLHRVRVAAADAGWPIEREVLIALLLDESGYQARAGDPDTSRDLLRQASAIAPSPVEQADIALATQRLGARFAVRRDEIIEQLESALNAVTGVDLVRQAQLTAALARELQHSVAEDRHRAGPLSEAALALARESNDDETLAACLLARHDALWGPGTSQERAKLGHEIATVSGRLGNIDRQAEGLLLEANGLLESGFAEFRGVLDRWFELLETRHEPRDRYLVETRRAALALLEGDTETAEASLQRAAGLGEEIHEPDTGNVLMSQRVALARARRDPQELETLAVDAVHWWTGAPILAHAVAAGAYAAAGDLDKAAREVGLVDEAGGWQSEGSYLRSVLVAHLAEAAVALGDIELCRRLDDDIAHLTESCGVNGAVVAFAGPFAHTAGILAGALGDPERADAMLERSIEVAQQLGASVWVRLGEAERAALSARHHQQQSAAAPRPASLIRDGKIWSISAGDEHGNVTHVKGLADIATLLRHRGQEVSALQLTGAATAVSAGSDELTDVAALRAYRSRLDELRVERDEAESDADMGWVERLDEEREQLLAEIRRVTGLGGRIRTNSNDPAERARKAVTARIRDAIRRIDTVAPVLASHLDRSIHTGLRCAYLPTGDDANVNWEIVT